MAQHVYENVYYTQRLSHTRRASRSRIEFELSTLRAIDTATCHGLSSSLASSSPGGDETNLLTRNGVAGHGGWVTNVLVVTTSMRMVNRVHGNTTSTRPDLPTLGLEPVVVGAGLEDGLLSSATTSNDSDHSTAEGVDGLLAARGQLDAGGALLEVVRHNDGRLTASAGEGAPVADLALNVGDDSTLGHLADGQNVSNGQLCVPSDVDKLASVHSLAGQEELVVLLVSDLVAELHTGNGSTTSRVVLDGADNTLDVAVALKVVQDAVAGLANAVVVSGDVSRTVTLSLRSNNATHLLSVVLCARARAGAVSTLIFFLKH